MVYTHNMKGMKAGRRGLTLRVRRVARRASGGRKSFGMLILSVEMALSRVIGTGRMCISALPSLLMGIGLPAAGKHREWVMHVLDTNTHSLGAETTAGYDLDCQCPDVDHNKPLISTYMCVNLTFTLYACSVCGSTVGKRLIKLFSGQHDRIRDKW